ncbi:MAG: 30S ribosomal protein S21 [Candidatus Saganbacteria bacterium]|nr:30S ribosomal protein S21 [Candidatus Saganbacteria bacterium]
MKLAKIEIRKEESIDKALRKFKSKIRKEGILEEMKRREFYEKPSQRRRREKAQAVKRERRRQRESDLQ